MNSSGLAREHTFVGARSAGEDSLRRLPLLITHAGAPRVRAARPGVAAGVAAALAVLVLLFAQPAIASQFERFGDLDVHYIVFNTTDLSPEMAERYGLTRSPDLGLVNISGRRIQEDGATTAVRLELQGTVTNLLGQSQPLRFREVEDPGAVYYLETVRFTDRETLRFDIRVTDTETGRSYDVRFQKALWRQ